MEKYKITGVEVQRLKVSRNATQGIRKAIAPELLGRYKEAIIDSLAQSYSSGKGHDEILQEHLKDIKEVLSQYTGRLENVTMMIKILRKSYKQTTNRAIHSANAVRIGTKIAEALNLNKELAEVMLMAHDNGHTPYGHDGEQWISDELEKLGLGYLWHNAEGVRRVWYRGDFKEQVISKIKETEPNIKPWKLNVIRDNLWVILDGILTHNGESTEKIFTPNTEKTEKDFEDELLRCYTEKGTDKTLVPATVEGCLLRISDIISYAARDFVDGMREGLITDIDSDYIDIFKRFGIDSADIKTARDSERWIPIAKKIENAAMQDVIENSDKSSIKMSQEMAERLFLLRKKNNTVIVNKVTRLTEATVMPIVIRNILEEGRDELISAGAISELQKNGEFKITEKLRNQYKERPHILNILEFAEGVNLKEYEFTSKIVEKNEDIENMSESDKQKSKATIMTAHFIASMTDIEFFKYIEKSGNLDIDLDTVKDPKRREYIRKLSEKYGSIPKAIASDLNISYKDIPGIENETGTVSVFTQKIEEQQEKGLKELQLNNSNSTNSNRNDGSDR